MKNQTFGLLLKAALSSISWCENKESPRVESDLGAELNVASSTIQWYKAGNIPPSYQNIKILATAAVKRGHMDRIWLEKFLRVAGYPDFSALVNELCHITSVSVPFERIFDNLPAPTYQQYIMRSESYNDVIEGLRLRTAGIMIVSLGGMGKTTLAREIAGRCLRRETDTPQFDAVVWISDKDQPGTTTLNVVLNEIALVMDCIGFTKLDYEQKLYEIGQLLRRYRVLLVVDNCETITDRELFKWLQRLPEPSKVLITTRELRKEFRSYWAVELNGMTKEEAWEFIKLQLRALRMEKLVTELSEVEPLIEVAGGNPLAIGAVLGYFKYSHKTLQNVVNEFHNTKNELFESLFTHCFKLLSQAACRVMMSLKLFSSSASHVALAEIADVQGVEYKEAIDQLIEFSLLVVERSAANSDARYTLHPLVMMYVNALLVDHQQFEMEARERWLSWYINLSRQVGYCWNDLERLNLLDPEKEAAYAALCWAWQNQRVEQARDLSKGICYYYFVRGLWEKQLSSEAILAEAAHTLSDPIEEANALVNCVKLLSNQGKTYEAKKYFEKMLYLQKYIEYSNGISARFYDATATYWAACDNWDSAQEAWEKSLSHSNQTSRSAQIDSRLGLATCLQRTGKFNEAQHIVIECLDDAVRSQSKRMINACQLKIASICIDQGNVEDGEKALALGRVQSYECGDQQHAAEAEQIYARIYALRSDLFSARGCLERAIDLFKHLGRVKQLAEVQKELDSLDNVD